MPTKKKKKVPADVKLSKRANTPFKETVKGRKGLNLVDKALKGAKKSLAKDRTTAVGFAQRHLGSDAAKSLASDLEDAGSTGSQHKTIRKLINRVKKEKHSNKKIGKGPFSNKFKKKKK